MTTPRPLAPLPRSARALLAAYRDAHEIPAAAKDRIWSVVGAEDAPAPAYDPLEHDAAPPPRRASGRERWLVWGAATLAAAAVLLLAWQLGGTLAERRHATRTPDAAVMQGGGSSPQGRASAGARARSEALSAELPVAAHAPVASDSTTVPGAPGTPGMSSVTPDPSPTAAASRSTGSGGASSSKAEPSRSQPGSDAAEPTIPAPGSTLAAERELVARAWRALALGETATALDAAAQHARRFPAGLLAPERAAIDTIARCRRGDADGPRRATTFHRAHPGSPLAERVDEACVASPKE